MYEAWNKAVDMLLRAYFESIRFFIIIVTIVGLYYGEFPVEGIFIFTLTIFIISHIVSITSSKLSKTKLNFLKISLLGIITSLIAVYFSLPNESVYFKSCFFIYFFILWKKGMNFLINEEDLVMYRNKFILSLIIILILTLITFGLGASDWYFNILSKYLISYIAISIIFLARTSLIEAYNKKYSNSINKNRNILVFTVLSTAIVLLIVLLTSTDFFGLGEVWVVDYISNLIVNLLSIIIYPIILLLSNIVIKFREYILTKNPVTISPKGDLAIMQQFYTEEYKDSIAIKAIEILKWVIILVLFALILYYIYKAFKELYFEVQDEEKEWEDREFILSVNDIKKGVKNQMVNLISKIKRVFKKTNGFNELPIIRRVYLETILKLSKRGFIFKNYFTPNEYLSQITDKKYIDAGLDILTDYYNEARYSNNKITKSKNEQALGIKEEINNIID